MSIKIKRHAWLLSALSVVGMVIMLLCAQAKVYTFVLKNQNLN